MKLALLITVFIIGLAFGILLMSLMAAQRIRNLERDVSYFKECYKTVIDETNTNKSSNLSEDKKENIVFKLEETERT